MKRSVLLALLLALAVPCLAIAQTQAAPPPQPGPEIQRLGYWVGTWKYEAADASGTLTYEWITGGFGLVGREEGTDPAGKYAYLRVWTFDPDEHVYTLYTVTNRRPGGRLVKATVTTNTWRGEWKVTVGGRLAAMRGTITEVTPTLATWKVERSVDGGPWTTITDGKFTRVK